MYLINLTRKVYENPTFEVTLNGYASGKRLKARGSGKGAHCPRTFS